MATFYPLTVSNTLSHIGGFAKTLQFTVPDNLKATFSWQAGQYVIIELTINNETVRRAYTISTSPHSNTPLQITVKRTREGLVSNYINDNINTGDVIKVTVPAGEFQLMPEKSQTRQHYFLAAGSGITPMMAMIETVLLAEPLSTAYLLYGNHNDETVIFRDELRELADKYPNRLNVLHVFSSPREGADFPHWQTGRINATLLSDLLQQYPQQHAAHFYICGPGTMNADCRTNLQSLGIANTHIHSESFVENVIAPTSQGISATAKVYLDDEYYTVDIEANQTLLAAFRKADIDPPFSCKSGTCGDCQATLTAGEVIMPSAPALNKGDIESGEILTCQSFAKTDTLKVTYES